MNPGAGPRCLGCGRRWAGAHPGCAAVEPAPARALDPDQPSAALAPPELPGHTIEKLLGRGGFGAVYLARD